MRDETFKKGIAMLCMAFPNITFIAEFYREMLADLTDVEFQAAVMKIIRQEKEIYPNTNMVAMIRRRALEQNYPTSGEAWEQANRWATDYAKVHPLVERAAKQIGRWTLTHTENLESTRAHFMKFYDEIVRKEAASSGERLTIDFNQNQQIPEAK